MRLGSSPDEMGEIDEMSSGEGALLKDLYPSVLQLRPASLETQGDIKHV